MSGSESAVEAAIPKRIGRYEVLVPLGSGGMATVYLARAEVVHGVTREFAVKLMHAHLRGDPDWAAHLLHEARIAARIRHPNVVQVVEAGDDPLGLFLVLEYIEGDTLSGLTRALRKQGKQLPLAMSGRILLDSLAGLHAAHELLDESGQPLQLVHRDFSPQNILVGVDGVGRLTDFGIAKATGGQVTATGMLKGKVSYMSPEQARGRAVDRRCDVWAAGVIAWELLAGQRLYPNRNDTETLLAVVSNTPPRLREVRPDIPPALDALVAEALTPVVAERCPDARVFRERLEAAWKAFAGLADAATIGPFVADAVSESLAKRKTALVREITPASTRERSGDSMVLGPVAADDGVTSFQFTAQRRRRTLAKGAGSVAVVAALGVGGMLWLRGNTTPPTASESPPPAAPPSAVVVAPDKPVSASVMIHANKKIIRVRLARRNVDIGTPANDVEIELLHDEKGVALPLEITSDTGTVVKSELGPKEGSVNVRFGEPAARPTARPVTRAKPKATDELAPTPFKKK